MRVPSLARWPLVDALGREHPIAGPQARIISAVPSLTELLFDLGLASQVVGCTAYCVHPADKVRAIPKVGGTKNLNLSLIHKLQPTHVVMDIDENTREQAEEIATFVPQVIVTHPEEVEDNLALYRLLGGIFDRQLQAEHLSRAFQGACASLLHATQCWPVKRVLYLIWKAPWMTVSKRTYCSRMLALLHWETVADDPARRYPEVTFSQTLCRDTDIILFGTEPFPFARRHLDEFRARYPEARAVLALVDGQMISWYGSRAIQGLHYLRAFAAALMEQR